MPVDDNRPNHVVVSGGSRGLGYSIVCALLDAGYRVSTFSRSPTPDTDSLNHQDGFFFAPADAADTASLERFVEVAVDRFGNPFGLINCAGVAIDGVLPSMPPGAIDQLLSVNLGGTLHLTRLVVRRMLLRPDGGAIIMISSIIGQRGYGGLSAYAATKGGMDAATRALSRELGRRQIRVNSIAPGYLDTDMTHGLSEFQRRQIERRTPMNRLGTPKDVVGLVLFLLSDQSQFITGQVITVDGGITA